MAPWNFRKQIIIVQLLFLFSTEIFSLHYTFNEFRRKKHRRERKNEFRQLVTAQRVGSFKQQSISGVRRKKEHRRGENKLNDFTKIDEALMRAL